LSFQPDTGKVKEKPDLVKRGRGAGLSVSRLLVNPAVAGLLVVCTIAYVVMLLFQMRGGEHHMDFSAFYVWGDALRHGIDPYSTSLISFADKHGMSLGCCHENAAPALQMPTFGKNRDYHCCFDRSDYPPLWVACWMPVSYLSAFSAYWLWQGVQFFSLAALLYLLVGADRGLTVTARLVLASLGALFYPVYQNISFNQPQVPIMLGMVIVQRLLVRRDDVGAGLLLAFLAHMKLYPLAIGGYLVIRGRWRAIVWLSVGIVAGVVVAGLAGGWTFVLEFPSHLGRLSNDVRQQSISYQVRDLIGWLPISFQQKWTWLMVMLGELAAIAIAAWCTFKSNAELHGDAAAYSIWVVLAALLGPGWIHYGVMLLMPFALIAACAIRREPFHPAIAWLVGFTYLLASLPNLVFYFFRHYSVFTGFAHFLLFGFIATLWFAWDAGRRPAAVEHAAAQ
jgi:hypothetical protein